MTTTLPNLDLATDDELLAFTRTAGGAHGRRTTALPLWGTDSAEAIEAVAALRHYALATISARAARRIGHTRVPDAIHRSTASAQWPWWEYRVAARKETA